MMTLFEEYYSAKFAAFIVAGGIAAVANIASRYILNMYFAVEYVPSIVYAYVVGMVVAFILNRLIVFKTSKHDSTVRQAMVFCLVNVLAVFQTVVISVLLDNLIGRYIDPKLAGTIAHIAGVMFPVFTSYIGHKRFSFKDET